MRSKSRKTLSAGARLRPVELDVPWMGRTSAARPPDQLFGSPYRVLPKVLLVLLLGLAFYLPNQAQFRIETGLRGVNVANVFFFLIGVVMLLMQRPRSEPPPLKVPLTLFILLLTWAVVRALAHDASAWVEDVTVYKNAVFYVLLYFLFFHAVRDRPTLRLVILVTLFVTFTSSVLGVRQALDYGIGVYNENRRVSAPFGWSVFDANRSAIFFCIYLQIVGAAALFMKSRPWLRLACGLTFALGLFAVFHTYSRQAYFIMAVLVMLLAFRRHWWVGVLMSLALYNYELWVPQSVVERVTMTAVDPFDLAVRREATPVFEPITLSDAPVFSGMADYQPEAFGARSASAAAGDAGAGDPQKYDESTESRFLLWSAAGELIQREPWGIGLNRFKLRNKEYVAPPHAGKDAHNYFVLITTEAGVLAVPVMLLLLGSLLMLGVRVLRSAPDDETRALGVGFVMATLAVMLGNVYGSRFVDGDVMGNYWILAAMAARLLQLNAQAQRDRHAPPPRRGAIAGQGAAGTGYRGPYRT